MLLGSFRGFRNFHLNKADSPKYCYSKLKEMERVFRMLLIEGNLGANEISDIPYNKLRRLCKKAIEMNEVNLEKIKSVPFYKKNHQYKRRDI